MKLTLSAFTFYTVRDIITVHPAMYVSVIRCFEPMMMSSGDLYKMLLKRPVYTTWGLQIHFCDHPPAKQVHKTM